MVIVLSHEMQVREGETANEGRAGRYSYTAWTRR